MLRRAFECSAHRAVPAFLVALLLACAGPRVKDDAFLRSVDPVEMDPVVVVRAKDPLIGLDGYDAKQLLELSTKLYHEEEYARSLLVLERFHTLFSDSALAPQAAYQRGLAHEALERYEEALPAYQVIMENFPEAPVFNDAHFRAAVCLGKLSRWEEVSSLFTRIRQFEGLSTMDELEARVGLGVSLFMQAAYTRAEGAFQAAVFFYEDQEKQEYIPGEYFLGQSRFYLGEIYARAFEAKRLSHPHAGDKDWAETMGVELEEKCQALLRAQNNFIRAIRVGHAGWATAAGYRIGSLYERLYDDLMKLPVPAELDEESAQYYRQQVWERVSVLVVKAIKIYEQSLQMAERTGQDNEWVQRASKSLDRMKHLYLESLRARAGQSEPKSARE